MKTRVGIIFGGKSAEHEVSLQSAKNIIEAIDKNRYEPVLIGIDKKGVWRFSDSRQYLENASSPKSIAINNAGKDLSIRPGDDETRITGQEDDRLQNKIDVAFPVLHGPFGEDGSVQGLLKLANIPFVGASVLGSAIGMDKDVMKRILREGGIATADYFAFSKSELDEINFLEISGKLDLPLFVKPANLGSSVGISMVKNRDEFEGAIQKAFQFDRKIIIEKRITGREIECAVLGNDAPAASLPGEIISNCDSHEFYSYEAKYLDENGAALIIPAKLDENIVDEIKRLSVKTFKTLCCEGMARVDMFLTPDNELFVNEINTIPGFTKISMYPKLWKASGKSYTELITELIELAVERHKQEKALKTSL